MDSQMTIVKKKKNLQLIAQQDVFAARILPVTDGFITVTTNEEDIDKLLQKECVADLKENNSSTPPPELEDKRTILENEIYDSTPEEIKEISRRNEWTKEDILSTFKIPRNLVDQKAKDYRLLLFKMRMLPHQIKCQHLQNIANHFTNMCPCSEHEQSDTIGLNTNVEPRNASTATWTL